MKIDIRKSRRTRIALWAFFCPILFLGIAAAQIPVTDDAFTSSAAPNANYGVSLGLVVQSATANGAMVSPIEFGGSTANTYIKFDLSAVPSNVSASNLAKVNLRLYVDFVVSPGKFDVYLASGPWSEGGLTANNAPGHTGAAIASGVSVTSALKYIDVDITSAWANGPPSNGLVLVPSTGSNIFVSFDSKENPLTSHDPELSISVNDASSLQLQQEITRAEQAENTISTNLSSEVVRAENAEGIINNALLTEEEARIAGDSALQQTINSLFTGNVTVGGTLSGATLSSGNGGFQFGNTEVLSILPGLFNLWVGQDAGRGSGANNTGSNNTATGFQTLFNNTSGGSNTANGARSLYSNTTGNNNTAIGNSALNSNTTGVVNTATGNNALVSNTTGGANTGVGDGALFGNTTGSGNTAIGRLSLAGLGTDASNNTGLGTNAGNSTNSQPTTGSSNTYVGYQSNSGDQLNLNNASAIGANSQVTASNALVLGSINGVNGATASTNVGIGTTAPQYTLDVNGTGNFTGPVTFAPNQTFVGDGSGLKNVMAVSALTSNAANTAATATMALTATTAITANNALQLNSQPASAYAQLAQNNAFGATQTINGNLILNGSLMLNGGSSGIQFSNGTSQTAAATAGSGVGNACFVTSSASPVPPPGYASLGTTITAGNLWTQVASMPIRSEALAVVAVAGKVYALGGFTFGNAPAVNTVEMFDPSSNAWSMTAPMPTARFDVGGAAVNGKLYAVGGVDNNANMLNTVEVYDPSSNAWSTAASLPFTADLPIVQSVNGKLYVFSFRAPVAVYDPSTNTWSTEASPSLPFPAAGAAVNGKIYIMGGVDGGSGNAVSTVEVYDPSSNTWSTAASMPTARWGLAADAVNGKIYAIGGTSSNFNDIGNVVPLGTVEVYDPSTNTWTTAASLPTATYAPAAADIGGDIYALGGFQLASGLVNTAEQFAPATTVYLYGNTNNVQGSQNTSCYETSSTSPIPPAGYISLGTTIIPGNVWAEVAPMPTPRGNLAAATLNGQIYAIGGSTADSIVELSTAVELYAPSTNSWSTAAALPKAGEGVAFPINGKIYFVSELSTFFWTTQVYDPSTNTWSTAAPKPPSEYPGTASAASLNGNIYVIGGFSTAFNLLNSVEVYNVSTDTWTTAAAMPTARANLAAAALNGKIYAIGGFAAPPAGGGTLLQVVEVYDPSTNTWSTASPLPTPESDISAATVNGKIYVVGGGNTLIQVYDPLTDSWSSAAPMPTARNFAAATEAGGLVYAIGGYQFIGVGLNVLASVEQYSPPVTVYTFIKN